MRAGVVLRWLIPTVLLPAVSLHSGPARAADGFPHALPLTAGLDTEPSAGDNALFSERARERSFVSVVASADAVFDTFGAPALVDGVSVGVLFSELLELMASARHVVSWEGPSPSHAVTGGFQVGARVPLDVRSRFWVRVGFEMGFSPSGPVSLLARVHLQARVRIGSSFWLGLSLLNPVVRNIEVGEQVQRGPHLGLMSGLELVVVL
ncbi:MAG: hypothetical protein ACT4TC_16200 [Myxococcaceae bacterium]